MNLSTLKMTRWVRALLWFKPARYSFDNRPSGSVIIKYKIMSDKVYIIRQWWYPHKGKRC